MKTRTQALGVQAGMDAAYMGAADACFQAPRYHAPIASPAVQSPFQSRTDDLPRIGDQRLILHGEVEEFRQPVLLPRAKRKRMERRNA